MGTVVVETWKFPPTRLYATVYSPDKSKNDPSEFDQEAWNFWAEKFRSVGLDPKIHIVNGNKKDNFWMMGETGPCGPCSELHVDLTPDGDTRGSLVNKGDARCIEIWNLVFIQFNANPDGTFSPLPAKHVDTGMGFERVTSIIQGTKDLTDFANAKISNYETDIFRPIFDALEKLSGKRYGSTLPGGEVPTGSTRVPRVVSGVAPETSSSQTSAEGSVGTGFSAGRLEEHEGRVCSPEQIALDIAFRVIADHIRTLSFAIADGIQPGNNDRNYVLRRILRRAVRYGRTLGFKEPFFYKLVDVLADTMGDVFPEIRARKKQVQETIRIEEEAFNKTLDRGIALFEEEVSKLMGSARVPRAVSGVAPETCSPNIPITIEPTAGAKYSKRNLPHFERPWAKYMVTFTTLNKQQLSPKARDITLEGLLFIHRQRRWQLFAACVMPDHVHLLFEPQIKKQDADGKPIFWSLTELLHSVKSFTAHEINKANGTTGGVWEKESFDRMMRSDADLEEKFHYICRNPWDNAVVPVTEPYKWLWTPGAEMGIARVPRAVSGVAPETSSSQISTEKSVERSARRDASQSTRDACAPQSQGTPEACASQISGAFAFKLYDEQGFPLDLTELMARERGLTVDKEGFEKLMEEQRARARAAQKKEVITINTQNTTFETEFIGYEKLEAPARVLSVLNLENKDGVVVDVSPFYAEMGGQVGDTGILIDPIGHRHVIQNTRKADKAFVLYTERGGPNVGEEVILKVDVDRRNAIQRHHTVTHLLHWALHEVASKEASQKGSFVGPDKLTFDFNSAPLTPQQVADIEKLVNERIVENAPVSWLEVKHNHVKDRKDIMQFFGEKYGEWVRVVQIGGKPTALDGYSMELCGGTHTRATGEIGLFRIVGENAIAAGVRRIEAVAGLEAYGLANEQLQLIRSIAGKINSPVHELEKKVELLLAHQKELEKSLKSAIQRNAAQTASWLLTRAHDVNGIPLITQTFPDSDGDYLQVVADALKGCFKGVVVLGGAANGSVALVASVSSEFTAKVQAGKIIQQIAPIVGGKGGGKPDNARGGGKDASKLDEALAKVKDLI